jgi:hypothetical protein
MVDILDEAIEDIKQEKAQENLFKYGKWFAMAVVLFLIGGTGNYLWKNYQTNKVHAIGGDYQVATLKMQSQEYQKGIEIMERLSVGDTSYSALAALNYASYLSIKKEFSKAYNIYKLVSENKNFSEVFRDFAELMQISMKLNAKEISELEAINQLEAYIKRAPKFQYSAKEELVALYLSQKDKEKAKQILTEIITSTKAPVKLKQRAESLVALAS